MTSSRPPVPYVILFIGRSGSTYLTEALDLHPDIRAMGECYSADSYQDVQARNFYESPSGPRVRGFKIKHRDIEQPDRFARMLKDVHVRVIHLTRRNLIKQVVSDLNAERLFHSTSDWNLRDSADRLPAFDIAPRDFAARLARFDTEQRALGDYVLGLELPTLSVQYEDLLVRHDETLDLVLRFLDSTGSLAPASVLKNTSDDLSQVIANLDEVRAEYVGTRHEAMFDEVLVPSMSISS